MQSILILLLFPSFIFTEGYICPIDPKYNALGQTSQNYLLYSYYDASGNTWISKNEYGFTSPEAYCSDKGNASLHPNENLEVKCNDSRLICVWQNNNCVYTGNYQCSSIALCDAVLNHQESACLGSECTTGGNNDFLYNLYCDSNTPIPIDTPLIDNTPIDNTPIDNTPIDNTPIDNTPIDNTPIDNTPIDNTPIDNTPISRQTEYIMYPNSNICKEKIIYI
jgi:hypothetical protein